MNVELLVTEMQKRPVLWNKHNIQYKNRHLVETAWDEVAKITDMRKEEVKAKWKNLRDTFIKEMKKTPVSRSGDGTDCLHYEGRWQHFGLMSFLKETHTPKLTEDNFNDFLVVDVNNAEAVLESPPSEIESPTTPVPSDPGVSKKRRSSDMTLFEQRLLQMEKLEVCMKNQREEDEGTLFFYSLLPYYRKLGDIQKLKVRNEFQNILIKELTMTPTDEK